MISSLKSRPARRVLRAFTIIEILVAIAITAVISTMMVTILSNVLSSWSRSSAMLTGGNQARIVLDQLALDLESAYLRRSTDVMFAATIPGDQNAVNGGQGDANSTSASWTGTDVKPGDTAAPNGSLLLNPTDRDLSSYRFGQAGAWLRFFTTPPDSNNTGSTALTDVPATRAIAYQITRRRVGSASAPYTYQLFRSEVRPFGSNGATNGRSTFAHGYDLFSTGYNNSADPAGPNDQSSGGSGLGDAGVIRLPRGEYVIGNGVIDFGVRIWVHDTDDADGDNDRAELVEAFPVDRRVNNTAVRRVFAATINAARTHPNIALPSGNFTAAQSSYGYPAVAEVMVRILTPEGVEILQSYEQDPARYGGATAGKWWELAEANSRVFTRRVEIRATLN
jgi:type II secretory pathway pseudopilin PulG